MAYVRNRYYKIWGG